MSRITKYPTCGKKAGQLIQRICLGCWQPFNNCHCPDEKGQKIMQDPAHAVQDAMRKQRGKK